MRLPHTTVYRLQLALMLAPFTIGLLLLVVVPVVLAVPIAFTDFDALTPPRWIGLDNFFEMARDSEFWNGLRASLILVALAVPVRVAGALGLALLLQAPGKLIGTCRAAVYVPTVVPDVAYALLWLFIFNPLFGPFNVVLWFFTGTVDPDAIATVQPGPTGWLLHPIAAQVAVVIMLAWTIGEGLVLMLAAVHDIPPELHESAAIDGADWSERFWNISLPLLAPFVALLAVRDTVWSFQASFVAATIVTGGGPYYATTYLPYWIYLNTADYQRFGYAAAMTLVMFSATALLVILQFQVVRRWRTAHFG